MVFDQYFLIRNNLPEQLSDFFLHILPRLSCLCLYRHWLYWNLFRFLLLLLAESVLICRLPGLGTILDSNSGRRHPFLLLLLFAAIVLSLRPLWLRPRSGFLILMLILAGMSYFAAIFAFFDSLRDFSSTSLVSPLSRECF